VRREAAQHRGSRDRGPLAQRHGVAIVPYGGGSGVLGGSVPPDGAIAIDLRAMDRLLALDETALLARSRRA
jgi:alkyldihydroxyacetonephosphate synthase